MISGDAGQYYGVWFDGVTEKTVSYEIGQKFHFKASGIEFSIILKAADSALNTVKYRGRSTELIMTDAEIGQLANEGWKDLG